MISVVIEAGTDEHALAMTLAALVPAAAEGFVREVLLCGADAGEGIRRIADALGCTLVDGGREQALRTARGDWVLIVPPGVRLEADWFHEAAAFIERGPRAGAPPRAAIFRHAVDDFGLRARLAELAGALVGRLRPPGTVLARREALAGGRRLPLARLRARAFVTSAG